MSEGGYWSAASRRVGRRRALGYGAAGLGAFALACGGGSKSDSGSTTGGSGTPNTQGAAPSNQSVGTVAANETPKPGGSVAVRIATTAPLDPIVNTTYTSQTISSFAFSRLLRYKTDSKPDTANNYEVTTELASKYEASDDGLTYTFTLQPAKFHNKAPINGRQVDSEDVKASVERFRNEPKNTNRNTFNVIDKVETPNPQTVVFRLSAPFGPFLSLLATAQYLWIMPKEALSGGWDLAKDQIGSGPFTFDSVQPDIEIKYKKNPNYYVPNRPYLDEFRHVVLADSQQETSQFQARRLDVADNVPSEQVKDVKKSNPDAQVSTFISSTLPFIAPQLRGNSVFKDERIRRAISMATDRDAMLQLSFDGQGIYQNMIPSSFGRWWVDPKASDSGPGAQYFKFNVKEAVALLKAVGYDENNKLSFKYIFTPNGYTERFNQWAQAVAGMLKDTKVLDPTLVQADYQGEYIKTGGVFFGNYEGVFFGLQSGYNDPHDYLFNTLHSKSTRNHVGVVDPQLDALIDKEQTTVKTDDRVGIVRDIQKYAMEKMYYATMFQGPQYSFLQPWVRGYYSRRGYGAGVESYLDAWLTK